MAREPSPRGNGHSSSERTPAHGRWSLDPAARYVYVPVDRHSAQAIRFPNRVATTSPGLVPDHLPTGLDELNARPSLSTCHQALRGR